MNGKGPSNGCLLSLCGMLVAVLAISFVVKQENPVRVFLDGLGVKYPVSVVALALVSAVILGFALGSALRSFVLNAIPVTLMFQAADLSDFPEADSEAFDRYTAEFELLGFERQLDYKVTATEGAVPPGFARLFRHPVSECFAEVNQAFPPDREPIPARSVIGSILSDGWSIATTDREPDSITYMLRRPKGLWASYPGMGTEELVKVHVGFRDRVCRDLAVKNITPDSTEGYFAHEQQDLAERRELLKKKNVAVGAIEMLLFSKRPKNEWLGDYAVKRTR
ncbi:MAG TPA: hypothetical protein VFV34_29620 [Blastocatellia bacterium]|nr:hypothetical protein [Blastocatellia bacterium]